MSKVALMTSARVQPEKVVETLSDLLSGRSIGDRYIVKATANRSERKLIIELDDGERFVIKVH